MQSQDSGRSALTIGLHLSAVDYSKYPGLDEETLKARIEAGEAALRDAGIEFVSCQVSAPHRSFSWNPVQLQHKSAGHHQCVAAVAVSGVSRSPCQVDRQPPPASASTTPSVPTSASG